MVAMASLVFILFLSLIVVRVAAIALTGVSREVARFQARSAWTGTGFTTAEFEQAVSHPVRREIISFIILLRNAGFVTAASALILSFVSVERQRDIEAKERSDKPHPGPLPSIGGNGRAEQGARDG